MADRLTSIRKQIAALEKRAADLLKAKNGKVIAQIKALIDKHSLTAEDLGFGAGRAGESSRGAKRGATAKKSSKSIMTAGVPRYRDPKSGKTWTGRGKPPAWIAGAKDRSRFLIDDAAPSSAKTPPKATRATKASSKKRAPKGR